MFGLSVGWGPVRVYASSSRVYRRRGAPWWVWLFLGPLYLVGLLLYVVYVWPFVAWFRHRRRRKRLAQPVYCHNPAWDPIFLQPPHYQAYPRQVLPPGYHR